MSLEKKQEHATEIEAWEAPLLSESTDDIAKVLKIFIPDCHLLGCYSSSLSLLLPNSSTILESVPEKSSVFSTNKKI